MKLNKQSALKAVDEPNHNVRLYLFCGEDQAQSRALAARLLESLQATKFGVSVAALRENPASLVDDAAALSLFGERRLIWIEPATNDIAEAAAGLLAAGAVENSVVAIAGSLPKSSALLKLAEASPLAVAFTAYPPEGRDAVRMVVEAGRRVGLNVPEPVAARLAESCGNDQAIVTRELEKLALYVDASPHSPKSLDHDMVDAVGADSSEGNFLRLADLALLGEGQELAEMVSRLSDAGNEAIPAIRSLQRRLLMLAPARGRIERGERIDSVMASFGKALFFKDKGKVERLLKLWPADELARISERAGVLERSLMFTEVPVREALGEELMAIARRARSHAT